MPTWIRRARILTPTETVEDAVLVLENGRIAAIEPGRQVSENPPGVDIIEADGLYVAPGYIDLHVHGGAGSDTMDATAEALATMARFFAQHGVTSYLPTTISQSPQAIARAIENAAHSPPVPDGAQPLGIHLEGPYLSPAHRGAQPEQWVRDPDPAEYEGWFRSGLVRLVALAPEKPGALECIRAGRAQGVRFSAGHTGATYDQVRAAIDQGVTQSTHTFNGMTGLHHREPGTVGAVLQDGRVFCEVIADGIHVHPAVLQLLARLKGVERTVLVTDAMRAAGLPDGEYDLGSQMVSVREGVARTQAGGLAGSTLTLDQAVRNMRGFTGLTVNQAVAMATLAPAAALGVSDRKGGLRPGMDADLVLLDPELNVQATLIGGALVHQAPAYLQKSSANFHEFGE